MTQVTSPQLYPGGLTRTQVMAWRNATFVIFALPGLAFATWISRVPAVRDVLAASTEQMGVLIAGIAVGSVSGLIASSHIVARFGARPTMVVTLVVGVVGLTIAGLGATIGANFWVVFAGLMLLGAGSGICDVAMNVSGAANERVLGRNIMPIYHAFFSLGTMIGAGLGALCEALAVPVAIHLGVVAVFVSIAIVIVVRWSQSEHVIEEQAESTDHGSTWRDRLSIWRDSGTLLIGLVVLGAAFSEGSANDWLALAMVDGHGLSNENGALVFGVFVTAMTVGRLLGVRVLDRYGRVPVLRASFLLAAVGLLVLIFVPVAWIAIIGAVAWGLGSALGFPVGMSAAADDPRKAAARVSAVATIGYCAFLVGPPAIGFLGEHVGLLNGLLVVLVLVAIAGVVSGSAREPQKIEA
ncbi:MAG: MFS transporter [Microbacteriaceae bacterium]